MTGGDYEPLRIALLHHDGSPGSPTDRHVHDLAEALGDQGHTAEVVSARPSLPAEALLRRRGFAESLTTVPGGLSALVAEPFDIAHAFTTPDALSALVWRRLTGRPVVFTSVGAVGREHVADRRLTRWLLERAVQDTDAVSAATDESRAALLRWLALDVPVLEAGDAAGHVRLYRELLGRSA